MVVRTGFGVGVNGDGASPKFLGAYARKIDRCLAVHAGGGGHIAIELIAWNNAHAIVLPVGEGRDGGVGVGVVCAHSPDFAAKK
jgi:hypothetical protein